MSGAIHSSRTWVTCKKHQAEVLPQDKLQRTCPNWQKGHNLKTDIEDIFLYVFASLLFKNYFFLILIKSHFMQVRGVITDVELCTKDNVAQF